MSFVQDRMTWHDMSQGGVQQTGNPLDVAIDGNAFLVVQTPRGERYTRNGALQINAQGQLVTSNGDEVLGDSGPIMFGPTDRDIVINPDGTIRVREGASQHRLRPRQAAPRRVRQPAAPAEGRRQHVRARRTACSRRPPAVGTRIVQGAIEKSNVRSVVEMTRMIELTRAYSEVAGILQQQGELRRKRDRAGSPKCRFVRSCARRSRIPCAHCTPPRRE